MSLLGELPVRAKSQDAVSVSEQPPQHKCGSVAAVLGSCVLWTAGYWGGVLVRRAIIAGPRWFCRVGCRDNKLFGLSPNGFTSISQKDLEMVGLS